MMEPSSITVVIPCYNSEKWIERTISSVLAQNYSKFDVFVVDDGSTDRSLEIIRAFGDAIRYQTGPNKGACAARNVGLKLCKSEFLFFLDADDYVEGEFLAGSVERLESSAADIAICAVEVENELGVRLKIDNFHEVPTPEEVFEGWFDKYAQPPCSIVWRSSFLAKIGGWDERVLRNQDGELMLRAMLSRPRLCYFDRGVGVYNAHSTPSLSKARKIEPIRSEIAALNRLLTAANGTEFEIRVRGFGQKFYNLAHAAFDGDDIELGRRTLANARRLGFNGHAGTPRHKWLTRVFGLELKSKLVKLIRNSKPV